MPMTTGYETQQTSIHRTTIQELRQKNPYATQSEIGRAVGLTRERVRQLLKKMGLPPVVKDPSKSPSYFCDYCGKLIYAPRSAYSKLKYCNRECYKNSRIATVECHICGNPFALPLSQWTARVKRQNTVTCSMACRGVTIGRQIKVIRAVRHWPVTSRLTQIDGQIRLTSAGTSAIIE